MSKLVELMINALPMLDNSSQDVVTIFLKKQR